ncbi:MAG: HTH domain-containing protein [Pigmentiphaga sp.]|nr:HTH domain-containing protein [Pigmentiphaga sp.]
MIIHRDYRLPYDSVVKIFDDKIEFYNPGKLPEGITISDLLSGNYKSTPRNRKIADFFKNMGWIEKYGSGISRIRRYFREAELPEPEFKLISEGFQVTVFENTFFDETKNVTKNVTENVTKNVTENRGSKIMDLMLEQPSVTTKQIAEILNVSKRTIIRDIDKLKDKGQIEYIGPARGGYWKIK